MRRLINWLVAVGVIAFVAVFSLVVALMPRSLPPSTQYIPAYPNATHLNQDYTSIINVKVLDFQTSANPQTIQDYYKGILLKEGWKIDTLPVPSTPDSLSFSYFVQSQQYDGGISFHTISYGYGLDLVIQQLENGETSVHIRLVAYPSL